MRSFGPISGLIFSALLVQTAVAGQPPWYPTIRSILPQQRAMMPRPDTKSMLIAQAKPVAPAPATPAASETRPAERVETTNFENWILTCREFVDGPKKRNCSMVVAVSKADTNQPIVSWTARQTDNGQLSAIIQTLPGVLLSPGIQLKLDNAKAPRKIAFEVCEPTSCAGSTPMDKAFVQEISGASKVTITVTSSAGQPVNFDFPIKGFEKALA